MASLMKTIKTKHTPKGPPKGSLRAAPKSQARFIESMECLPVSKLPQGPEWSYEIKLDGFRLSPVKKNDETTLYSRRGNILNRKFHYIATALKKLPDNTVLDGELVALDSKGNGPKVQIEPGRADESMSTALSPYLVVLTTEIAAGLMPLAIVTGVQGALQVFATW
jgi:ATP-dependent DNA ligase